MLGFSLLFGGTTLLSKRPQRITVSVVWSAFLMRKGISNASQLSIAAILGGLIAAAWNRRFRRLKPCFRVSSVTERLRRGATASAKSKGPFGNRVVCSIPIDQSYVATVYQVWAIRSNFDGNHLSLQDKETVHHLGFATLVL